MNTSITFVIPAYNAAATICDTLASLVAQTRRDWAAIVVDDGSEDNTSAVVTEMAAVDARIRLIHTTRKQVTGARNAGLKQADSDWVCFLDADDRITPEYVARMMRTAVHGFDLVYCGYKRVTADGRLLSTSLTPAFERNAFPVTALYCPVAVHCVVVKRQALLDAGGFDTTLEVCEDWDLWQRIARTGIRVKMVPEIMAIYVIRTASLSTDNSRMLRDGLVVLGRGHKTDTRVIKPAPEFEQGVAPEGYESQAVYLAAWCAGANIGAGKDGALLLSQLSGAVTHGLDIDKLAQSVAEGMIVGSRLPFGEATKKFRDDENLQTLAISIARKQHLAGFAIALIARVHAFLAGTVTIDFAHIEPLSVNTENDRVVINLNSGTHPPVTFSLAAFGEIPASTIAEAALDVCGIGVFVRRSNCLNKPSFYRALLVGTAHEIISAARVIHITKSLENLAVGRRLRSILRRAALASYRDRLPFALRSRIAKHRASIATVLEGPAIVDFADTGRAPQSHSDVWEKVFSVPDPWKYTSSYEQRKYQYTLDILPKGRIGKALELACAEGHFTAQLADRVIELIAADISTTALERARERCANKNNIDYKTINIITDELPAGQDLITCSEVLYYLDSIDQIVKIAEKIRNALAPDGKIVMANHFLLRDDKSSTGFDWDQAYGAKVVYEHFSRAPGLRVVKSLVTSLYRIDVFERVEADAPVVAPEVRHAEIDCELHHSLSRYIVWNGAVARRREVEKELTWELPVLTYHRVAEDCDLSLRQWCVRPDEFEKQMRFLRSHGFHAVTSITLAEARRKSRPLPGRPILITFDDGYLDTATTAWPILRNSDFCPEIFIVTDLVGTEASWDAELGKPAALMDWNTIRELHGEGVSFGSHLATHTPATFLTTEDLLDEALRSRLTLIQQLRTNVHSIAAPYGLIDERFVQVCRLSGYDIGFSCNNQFADMRSFGFNIPRIEVSGHWSIAQFASSFSGLDSRTC